MALVQMKIEAIKNRIRKIVKFALYKVLLPMLYICCKRKPIDEKLVLFADLRDREMPDNFVGLYNMCEENGYKCVFLSGKSFGKHLPFIKRKVKQLKFHWDYIRLFAQCRALFLVEYFPLADIVKPRKGTDIVQLWHGCGAMKVVGYAAEGKNWGSTDKDKKRYPMHRYYSLASVSSETIVKPYIRAFRAKPGIVRAFGVPRTDIYFDENYAVNAKQKLQKMFPEIGNRKIILFAPTFRGQSIAESTFELELDIKRMKEVLGEEYVLVVKYHPLMVSGGMTEKMKRDGKGFVFDVTKSMQPEDVLGAADLLIGDYSSIMFEYMLLERPMISYIPDINEYIADRGFFFPYEDTMPGPYVYDQTDLIEKIQNVDEWFDLERTRKYKEKFMSACDGKSTERIFNIILNRKKV